MMKPSKTFLYSAGLFLSGLSVGILFMLYTAHHHHFDPGDTESMVRHMKKSLTSRLSLTSEQAAKIEPILRKRANDLAQIHAATREKIRQAFESGDREILLLLDPEQQKTFESFKKQRMARHHEPP